MQIGIGLLGVQVGKSDPDEPKTDGRQQEQVAQQVGTHVDPSDTLSSSVQGVSSNKSHRKERDRRQSKDAVT